MAIALFAIGYLDPVHQPVLFCCSIFLLSLFSGCLYIVGLAFEIESLEIHEYSMGSACVISGYRTGLLCAGAVALYFAFLFGWSWMYYCISSILLFGALLVLLQPEPKKSQALLQAKKARMATYTNKLWGFWQEVLLAPCKQLFQRKDLFVIIIFIFLFKFPDELLKSMEGPFYLHLGFTKQDLALASKMWGFVATITGAFFAGQFIKNRACLQSCAAIGMLHTLSLGTYFLQAFYGKSFSLLYITTATTHFTAGMAMACFIYLLWKISDSKHAPVQYALLWSFFSFKAHLFSSLGGIIASQLPWTQFFALICIAGTFSSIISWYLVRKKALDQVSVKFP